MRRAARAIACVFGVGFLPWAPGTWATLLTLPLADLARTLDAAPFMLLCLAVTMIGTWAASHAVDAHEPHDPGWIVIDEVAGSLVALACVDRTHLASVLLALLLFRALDILKPWPIGVLDRRISGGVGVMADDLAAGLAAGAFTAAWMTLAR